MDNMKIYFIVAGVVLLIAILYVVFLNKKDQKKNNQESFESQNIVEQNNPNVNTKVVFDPRNGKIIEITEADDYDLTYGSDSLKAMQKDAMQL